MCNHKENINKNKDCHAVDELSNCRAVDNPSRCAAGSNGHAINVERRRPDSQTKDQRAVAISNRSAVNDANDININNKTKTNIEKLYSIIWRIALPNNMLTNLVCWHHELTMHTEGADRTYKTLSIRFYHPDLQKTCHKEIAHCDICKMMKTAQRQYGLLAPKDAVLVPWYECHVDDVGPWTITVKKEQRHDHDRTCLPPHRDRPPHRQ